MEKTVWLFHGDKARFTSAEFSSRALAEAWIAENGFSGMLTEYPVDISVYDFHQRSGIGKKYAECSLEFKQNYTSASQDHYHYQAGKLGS